MVDDTYSQHRSELVHQSDTADICVIGIGYVGLSVAVAFDRRGVNVTGYDIDEKTIARCKKGIDDTGVVGDKALSESDISFTTDPTHIADAEFIIIAVPTPIDEYQSPEMGLVESAGEAVGEHLTPGSTVVLESTVFPGATREHLIPALERSSGFTVGEEFSVGYSPERISPGDTDRDIHDVVKIVSGYDTETTARVARLYERIIDAGVHQVPSIEVAEMVKTFENVQRKVNIALVNELALVCDRLGIETDAVLDGASTKWNFHEYSPGLVGGHCIPVDPIHYMRGAQRAGYTPNLVHTAREVNDSITRLIADRVVDGLNECGKTLQDSQVLVLGLSYKANVGDLRNSKVFEVIDHVTEYDVEVDGYDPFADDDTIEAQFGIETLDELSYEGYDAVLLGTGHDMFSSIDLDAMSSKMVDSPLLVDIDGVIDESQANHHGFAYRSI